MPEMLNTMKTPVLTLATALLLSFAVFIAGCGGEPKTKLDTTELVTAFASADPAIKSPVDAAAKALVGGKLLEGMSSLATVAKANHEALTEPQKDALVNLVTTVQTIMAEDGNKVDLKVYQAADNIIAGMEGREAPKVGINPDAVRPTQPVEE